MKKIFYIILICFFFSCNQKRDLNNIFNNEKCMILFEEFCNEALISDYKNGNNIIISLYGESSEKEYCLSIRNIEDYKSNDKYGRFRYKGFNIYINKNVPNSIIELSNYNKTIKEFENKNKIPTKREFLEMYICIQKDTMKVMKVNFEDNKYLNEWQIIN